MGPVRELCASRSQLQLSRRASPETTNHIYISDTANYGRRLRITPARPLTHRQRSRRTFSLSLRQRRHARSFTHPRTRPLTHSQCLGWTLTHTFTFPRSRRRIKPLRVSATLNFPPFCFRFAIEVTTPRPGPQPSAAQCQTSHFRQQVTIAVTFEEPPRSSTELQPQSEQGTKPYSTPKHKGRLFVSLLSFPACSTFCCS